MTKEALREYKRAWRKANPDKVNAQYRRWYQKHKDVRREQKKRYYTRHKDVVLAANKRWRNRNLTFARMLVAWATIARYERYAKDAKAYAEYRRRRRERKKVLAERSGRVYHPCISKRIPDWACFGQQILDRSSIYLINNRRTPISDLIFAIDKNRGALIKRMTRNG